MLLGVHVSIEGKIFEAFTRAQKLECNTIEKCKIKPLFIHIPYLINLASPNPRLYKASIQAYIEDIQEASIWRHEA